MPPVENLEYLNLNSFRSYPIKEGMSRTSVDNLFVIPNDLIVDCVLSASSDVTKRFYISRVSSLISQVIIDISDSSDTFVGNFVIDVASHTLYQQYNLLPGNLYSGANGRLVVGSLTNLQQQPSGIFLFTLATAELEARVSVPTQSGISQVTFKNISGDEFSVTGNVNIQARVNLKFTYEAGTNTVWVDAGEDLGLNRLCTAEEIPITTINGVSPDEYGNFILDFSDCLTITVLPSNDGLLLNDVCCKPCIGCEEIGTLTDRVVALETDLLTLRTYYVDLNQMYENFRTVVTFTCECP